MLPVNPAGLFRWQTNSVDTHMLPEPCFLGEVGDAERSEALRSNPSVTTKPPVNLRSSFAGRLRALLASDMGPRTSPGAECKPGKEQSSWKGFYHLGGKPQIQRKGLLLDKDRISGSTWELLGLCLLGNGKVDVA